jgi:hypothetical protein
MALNLKSRFWKISRWFALFFLLLFVFRLIYGYLESDTDYTSDYGEDFFSNLTVLRKNYASEKINNITGGQQLQEAGSSQKFEKTATVRTKSTAFEQDEKLIRTTTNDFNAVIQYEQSLGKKGNRELHLLIGVNPVKFDSFYTVIQKVGQLRSLEITKVDKTNEYRQLNAKKLSIEKTLQSLNELKSKGGAISDYVSLNDKILEVEEKLQELGVELGNFDSLNEFCTVKLSVYEGAPKKRISLLHRIKVALEWTIHFYAILILCAIGIVVVVFFLLVIVEKLKMFRILADKWNE